MAGVTSGGCYGSWNRKFLEYSRYFDDNISGRVDLKPLLLWVHHSGLIKKVPDIVVERAFVAFTRERHIIQLNNEELNTVLCNISHEVRVDLEELKQRMSEALPPQKKYAEEFVMLKLGLSQMYMAFKKQDHMSLKCFRDWSKASHVDVTEEEIKEAHLRCYPKDKNKPKKYILESSLQAYMRKLESVSSIDYEVIRHRLAMSNPPVGINMALQVFMNTNPEWFEDEEDDECRSLSTSDLSQSSSCESFYDRSYSKSSSNLTK